MTTTDTSEKGLERLICTALTGHACDPGTPGLDVWRDEPAVYGGPGWIGSAPENYEREYCVDLRQLRTFLKETQSKVAEALDGNQKKHKIHNLLSELARSGEIVNTGSRVRSRWRPIERKS